MLQILFSFQTGAGFNAFITIILCIKGKPLRLAFVLVVSKNDLNKKAEVPVKTGAYAFFLIR
jgi:hypothetical protein